MEQRKNAVKQKLMSEHVLHTVKRKLKEELMKSKYDPSELKANPKLISQIMERNNWHTTIQNEIFRLDQEANEQTNRNSRVTYHPSSSLSIIGSNDKSPKNRHDAATSFSKSIATTTASTATTTSLPPVLSVDLTDESLDCIQHARCAWAKFIKDQILSISKQLDMPLCTVVNRNKPMSLKSKRSRKFRMSNSSYNGDDYADDIDDDGDDDKPRYTGVYSCVKLYDICIHIQSSNHSRNQYTTASWGLIKLELRTMSKRELQDLFSKLNPEVRQFGVDDESNEWFADNCLNQCKTILQSNYMPALNLVAQTGLPPSIRPKIWSRLLNVTSSEKDKLYFRQLMMDVSKRKLMVDSMVHNDVKRTSDDENYFIFNEVIDAVMIAFSRDSQVYDQCKIKPVAPMTMTSSSNITSIPYPPSGVTPFEGISLMASPFAYLYDRVEDLYFAFRNFYCRYLCKLHTISSKNQSLIHLCKMFEDLLQNHDPQLFYHLIQLKIAPLEIAFNWIYHGFAGYLNVDQLLLLWDRILGFDNLYLLPILSVAIFSFRSKFLLRVETKQEIYDVFSDFTVVKVIPLLQIFLFT